MNNYVCKNFAELKPYLFIPPIIIILGVNLFLFFNNALNTCGYIDIQKDAFLAINHFLSSAPELQNNLTQLGDAFIVFSLLAIMVTYAPKIWQALIVGSLVSLVVSFAFKKLFAIPRPAAIFDRDDFTIIGKTLTGHNSLPSGHSITVFTTLTILLFALMPKQIKYKAMWCATILIFGCMFAFSRVGVGAHYPLDVVVGSAFGYICGLTGILLNRKFNLWFWVNERKHYVLVILFHLVACSVLVGKILISHTAIFYLSLFSVLISLSIFANVHVRKTQFKFRLFRTAS